MKFKLSFPIFLIMSLMVSSPALAAEVRMPPAETAFVSVKDGHFHEGGQPYCFVGANIWYGAYLGADSDFGDRARLRDELDRLKQNGITNLRVLGASEASPLRDSLKNTFRDASDHYNETLLKGLDFLLDELGKRDMKAVIYLNNFWEWSGGMATYLYWTGSGEIVDPSSPEHPWPAFAEFASRFYADQQANALFRDYIRFLVSRTNSVNGLAYIEDPTIMSWQLANEPRPGHQDAGGFERLDGYLAWVEETAGLIKSLDPNHLVSTGSEGTKGCLEDERCYLDAHQLEVIDYLTFHMWPANWGWFDEKNPQGTFEQTVQKSQAYIDQHLALAEKLGKPIVMEEFGLNRDLGAFATDTTTSYRDRFYALVFERIEKDRRDNGLFSGSNFWAWGGAGRAQHENHLWQKDDRSYMGDPPQEAQGLYSVFDSDTSTLELIGKHARTLSDLACSSGRKD